MYFHWYIIIIKRWIHSHPTLKSTKLILINIKAVSYHSSPKWALDYYLLHFILEVQKNCSVNQNQALCVHFLLENIAIWLAYAISLLLFSHLFSFFPSIIQKMQARSKKKKNKKKSVSILSFYAHLLWSSCLLCVVWTLLIEYLFVYKTQKLIWLLCTVVFPMRFYCHFPVYFALEYTF